MPPDSDRDTGREVPRTSGSRAERMGVRVREATAPTRSQSGRHRTPQPNTVAAVVKLGGLAHPASGAAEIGRGTVKGQVKVSG